MVRWCQRAPPPALRHPGREHWRSCRGTATSRPEAKPWRPWSHGDKPWSCCRPWARGPPKSGQVGECSSKLLTSALCVLGKRWRLAQDLVSGTRASLVTQNALLAACSSGSAWRRATTTLANMGADTLQPDALSTAMALGFCDWRRALAPGRGPWELAEATLRPERFFQGSSRAQPAGARLKPTCCWLRGRRVPNGAAASPSSGVRTTWATTPC